VKFSLSNLMLFTALVATLFGWAYDHYRLSERSARLNQEAASMMQSFFRAESSGTIWNLRTTAPRAYNFSVEQDRVDYRRDIHSERGAIEVNF
jgi:hypothetical protein